MCFFASGSTRPAGSSNASSIAEPAIPGSISRFAEWPSRGSVFSRRSIDRDKRLRVGSDIGKRLLADQNKGRPGMIEAEWWEYDSAEEMADAVAGDVGFIVESALDARDAALIALPGGATPKPIFQKLAARQLPWKRVTIIPTDDRLVPMDDERSNIRAISCGPREEMQLRIW